MRVSITGYSRGRGIGREVFEPRVRLAQVTIRLSDSEIAVARQQAEVKGLRYQTYIKMLLHEALARNAST